MLFSRFLVVGVCFRLFVFVVVLVWVSVGMYSAMLGSGVMCLFLVAFTFSGVMYVSRSRGVRLSFVS